VEHYLNMMKTLELPIDSRMIKPTKAAVLQI
jgi:hypothetical protein